MSAPLLCRAAARASRLSDHLRATPNRSGVRGRWISRRLRRAVRASGAAHDPAHRAYLLEDIAASRNSDALADLAPASPWEPAPGSTPAERYVIDRARQDTTSATENIRARLKRAYPGETFPVEPAPGGRIVAYTDAAAPPEEKGIGLDGRFRDAEQLITGAVAHADTPTGDVGPALDDEAPVRLSALVPHGREAAADSHTGHAAATAKLPQGQAPHGPEDLAKGDAGVPSRTCDDESTNVQDSTEWAETPRLARSSSGGADAQARADRLAPFNRERAAAARRGRAELAAAWHQAGAKEPELTKETFAARHNTTAQRLRNALRDNPAYR